MRATSLLLTSALILGGGAVIAQDASLPVIEVAPMATNTMELPKGIPGYFDPATNRFTPLKIEATTAIPPITGILHAKPRFIIPLDRDFVTISCSIRIWFGSPIPDHTEDASASFTASSTDDVISKAYKYTPTTTAKQISDVLLACQATDATTGVTNTYHEIKTVVLGETFHTTVNFDVPL